MKPVAPAAPSSLAPRGGVNRERSAHSSLFSALSTESTAPPDQHHSLPSPCYQGVSAPKRCLLQRGDSSSGVWQHMFAYVLMSSAPRMTEVLPFLQLGLHDNRTYAVTQIYLLLIRKGKESYCEVNVPATSPTIVHLAACRYNYYTLWYSRSKLLLKLTSKANSCVPQTQMGSCSYALMLHLQISETEN